jgi:hypothetical protein
LVALVEIELIEPADSIAVSVDHRSAAPLQGCVDEWHGGHRMRAGGEGHAGLDDLQGSISRARL